MSITEKLLIINENTPKVYAAGEKKQYDYFWDHYQTANVLRNYAYSFSFYGWNDWTFIPKYNIVPDYALSMFYNSQISNIKQKLAEAGVQLILDDCVEVGYCFANSLTLEIPELNCSSSPNLEAIFHSCVNLTTVDKLIVADNANFYGAFQNCYSLEHLTIEGNLTTSIDLGYSPLSIASMKNVISCLRDVNGAEQAPVLTFRASCWDRLNNFETPPENYDTWQNYIASLGWSTAANSYADDNEMN